MSTPASAAVLAEARRLQQLNYACAGVCITGTPQGKKLSAFPPGWQKAQPDTYMDYFTDSHNALILCTGEHSDRPGPRQAQVTWFSIVPLACEPPNHP